MTPNSSIKKSSAKVLRLKKIRCKVYYLQLNRSSQKNGVDSSLCQCVMSYDKWCSLLYNEQYNTLSQWVHKHAHEINENILINKLSLPRLNWIWKSGVFGQ